MKRLTLIALMLSASIAFAADWPEFRGPSASGISLATDLPLNWSPDENIGWRTELPGEGWSSPVVKGDTIYLTAAIPSDTATEPASYELALLIIDANTGTLRKQVTLFSQSVDAPDINKKNSHASPTPVINGAHIYVHFGHQGTACTTLDGNVIWKNDSLGFPPVHGNGGSPVVVDDLVIISRDGADISEVLALESKSGRIAWQTERRVRTARRFSFCTPLLIEADGRRQLIFPGSDVVQSLEPKTGNELWRVTYSGYSVVPRPLYAEGLVFVCTGFGRPSLLAIDPTGNGDVTDTHVKWENNSNISKTPSVVGFDGKVALISDRGIASCFEAKSGDLLWTERIGGNHSASPLINGHHLYFLSEEGICTVLDVRSDPVELATNSLDERSLASMAVIENDLLIRTAKALYRISE